MITGISAPPMGRTSKIPSSMVTIDKHKKIKLLPLMIKLQHNPKSIRANDKIIRCNFGKVIGNGEIKFCSLAKAIKDPEKAKAPIIRPTVLSKYAEEPPIISAIAIKTAASPPRPLKAAIICGKEVILTFIAL